MGHIISITLHDDGMGSGYVRGEPESENFRLQYSQNVEALFEAAYPDASIQSDWCGERDVQETRVSGIEREDANPILDDAWERTCRGEWLWWTGSRLDSITVETDSAVGPRVLVDGEFDEAMIESSLPSGWTVGENWHSGVRTDSGAISYPLVRADVIPPHKENRP